MTCAYTAPNGATYGLKIAAPSDVLLEKRLKNGGYRIDEDEQLHKRCSRCREYWPADTEFFYTKKGTDGLHDWCKACYQEWRYPSGRNEKAKPIAQEEAA
jgi:hypothetical protein